jgi:hypothetical protein
MWHVEAEPEGWFTNLQNFNAIACEKGVPTAIYQAQSRGSVALMSSLLPQLKCPFISGVSAEVAFYWYVTMGSFATSFFEGAEIDASKATLHVQMDVVGDGGATFDAKKLTKSALLLLLSIIKKKNAITNEVSISMGNQSTRQADDPVVVVPTFIPYHVFSYIAPQFTKFDPYDQALAELYIFFLKAIRWKKFTIEQIDERIDAGESPFDIMADLWGTSYDANCNTCENPHDAVADDFSFNSPAVPPGTEPPDPVESWDRPWQENGSSGAPSATIGYVRQDLLDAHLFAAESRMLDPADVRFGRATFYHDDGDEPHYTYTVPSRFELYWLDRITGPDGQPSETQKLCRLDPVLWLYSQYQQNVVVQQGIANQEEKRVDEAVASGNAEGDSDIELPGKQKKNIAAAKKGNGAAIAALAAGAIVAGAAVVGTQDDKSSDEAAKSSQT